MKEKSETDQSKRVWICGIFIIAVLGVMYLAILNAIPQKPSSFWFGTSFTYLIKFMYRSLKRWQNENGWSERLDLKRTTCALTFTQSYSSSPLFEIGYPAIEHWVCNFVTSAFIFKAASHHAIAKFCPTRHIFAQIKLFIDFYKPLSNGYPNFFLDLFEQEGVASQTI